MHIPSVWWSSAYEFEVLQSGLYSKEMTLEVLERSVKGCKRKSLRLSHVLLIGDWFGDD